MVLERFGYDSGASKKKRRERLRRAVDELGVGKTHKLLRKRKRNAKNGKDALQADESFIERKRKELF